MGVEKEYIECFQEDRRQKLQLCFENLDKIDLYPLDPMHDQRHQAQVERTALWLAEAADLGEDQKDYIRRATPLHDSGYSFVEMGILRPEEHAIGSGLIALQKTGDVQLARGIVQHSYDVLPPHITPWVLILREADRADRWGWQGVISTAYYMGFRHDLVSGPVIYQSSLDGKPEVVDEIRDIRHPETVSYRCRPTYCIADALDGNVIWTWTDYEEKAADFVRGEVFPYLHRNGLLNRAHEQLEVAESWIEGVESEDSTWDQPKWTVDSVIDEGSYTFFNAKRFNTEQAMWAITEYAHLHSNEAQNLKNWVELKSSVVSDDKREPAILNLTLRHIESSRPGSRKYRKECNESLKLPHVTHQFEFCK
jgi:hypothetical protein